MPFYLPWLLLVLFDGQKTNTLQSQHSGVGLLLYLEEYLSGEPVGGGGVWGQACKVPLRTSLVQELPLTNMKLWGSKTQETVKEVSCALVSTLGQCWRKRTRDGEGSGAGKKRRGGAQVRNVRAYWIQD